MGGILFLQPPDISLIEVDSFLLSDLCLEAHPLAWMVLLLDSLRLAGSRLQLAHQETCSTKQGESGISVCTNRV